MAKKKIPMMRTTIYLPVKVHRAMKVMAAVNGVSMADLLREALVETYKDDQADIREARESIREMKKHPEDYVDAREFFAKRREMERQTLKEGETNRRRTARA